MKGTTFKIQAGGQLAGVIPIPGDKSISHRSIMLASIANGTSQINGLLRGEDVLYTMAAMRKLGVHFEEGHEQILVHGGKLKKTVSQPLYLGNSGTAARLLLGLLGGMGIQCELHGDTSLSKRPMQRVVKPLQQMGVNLQVANTLPIKIQQHQGLQAIEYKLPIASAQVKSCLLLAALNCQGTTSITEPNPSRNHSELMLQNFGIKLSIEGQKIQLPGKQSLTSCNIDIPSDISSAAFFIVAACLLPNSDITLRNIGINTTRDGIIKILKQMGANIDILEPRYKGTEKVADIRVRYAPLQGINIDSNLVPSAIDEFPVLFVAAAMAKGKTNLRKAGELRHKESDRLHNMAQALRKCQIEVQEYEDGIEIIGSKIQPPSHPIDANHDHRIAMAMSVAGMAMNSGEVVLTGCQTVDTSFPKFQQVAAKSGMKISKMET